MKNAVTAVTVISAAVVSAVSGAGTAAAVTAVTTVVTTAVTAAATAATAMLWPSELLGDGPIAHGDLRKLVKNGQLNDLVGGVKTVTVGDMVAAKHCGRETLAERASAPTFEVVVMPPSRLTRLSPARSTNWSCVSATRPRARSGFASTRLESSLTSLSSPRTQSRSPDPTVAPSRMIHFFTLRPFHTG